MLYEKPELNHLCVIPAIFIVAASGSRKALIFTVVGCLLIIIQRYSSKNIVKNVLRYLLIAVIAISLIRILSKFEIFSVINERMEGLIALITGHGSVDSSADKRNAYMNAAFSQFLHSPVVGIGMDNCRLVIQKLFGYATYSHNNFAELLCNGVIIGFVIYYSMNVQCLWTMIKYRKINDMYTPICITLLIVLLIMDWGQISYYSKSTYFYYMVFYLHIKNILKKVEINEVKKDI